SSILTRSSTRSPRFPYTTLFRSARVASLLEGAVREARQDHVDHAEQREEADQRQEALRASLAQAERDRARADPGDDEHADRPREDRKSTRLNSSHVAISYAVFCL